MKSAELRQAFLEYFRSQGHEIVPSSSLVPANDPTLLFTNAGMVQFKDVFLGKDQRSYARATTAQRCVRAGGKHNDLENVGYTSRHHTFFEMLGNFSFGDYFKREAIRYAWELCTATLGLSPERLWVTVFEDDDEAADVWLNDIGIDPAQFVRLGMASNFWAMGDTGPCGPCSEIFYDHGPDVEGGPPGSAEEHGDRYVEIWNLVFMQFDRTPEGMESLPKPSVDTGMGLERMAAVLQGVHDNYEIDLFKGLVKAAAEVAGTRDMHSSSLRVIADHIRACAFLVADGVMPSNERRGYVLRRIIRRAVRHGYKLGIEEPFFFKLVAPLDDAMGEAYPVLREQRSNVEQVLLQEEERFAETLSQGMRILEEAFGRLSGDRIPGEIVFKLYDTFGFPVDLTADIARERGLSIDHEGFEHEMAGQRARARAASKFELKDTDAIRVEGVTEFSGYDHLVDEARVTALFRETETVETLEPGESGIVVLDRTPFYAESGGQVGDFGILESAEAEFVVTDTQKIGGGHAHFGVLERGQLRVGDVVEARVDAAIRAATVLNHSATHLLHAALRKVLGTHVTQKGSLVAPDRLRFDFSHPQPLTHGELREIETLVNDQIRDNTAAEANVMAYDDAIDAGALALFGEKYGEDVRVLRLGDFSTELCGGTHVKRAGDIGLFKITGETGIAAGVRRIEAVTGRGALQWVRENEQLIGEAAAVLKSGREELPEKIRQLMDRGRQLEKEIERLQHRLASGQGEDLAAGAEEISGVKVIAKRVDGVDKKALRNAVDQLKNRLGTAVIVLAAAPSNDKVLLVAGVTKDKTEAVSASELVNEIAVLVGGRGGGRADMAEAGGRDASKLDAALDTVADRVRERLA